MTFLPPTLPDRFDAELLLALRDNPPRMGMWAMEVRARHFERRCWLRPTPAHPIPVGPAVVRRDELVLLESWPAPEAWQPGDRVLLPINPHDQDEARRYAQWLLALAERVEREPLPEHRHLGPCSIAPFSHDAAGTHRLWAIAAARLALPPSIHVEARHDLVGIRLAQVALGFGADTLSGPIEAERSLPVAGVTRPDEATITGLRNLIEQAGLECALREDNASRVREVGQQTVRISIDAVRAAIEKGPKSS